MMYALLKDGSSSGTFTRGFDLVAWAVVALQVGFFRIKFTDSSKTQNSPTLSKV